MEENADIRENAEIIKNNNSVCDVCQNNLILIQGCRKDKAVCINCGFPYKIEVNKDGEIIENTRRMYLNQGITTEEYKCLRKYYDETGNPATLWSYSAFGVDEFIDFSDWAIENGFDDFAWY